MFIYPGFLAASLLIGLSLVSAQVDTLINCLENGYSQCWCGCSVPLVNQYCPSAATLAECSCTNANYHSQANACLQNANCANLAAGLAIASSNCAEFGYPLTEPTTTASATGGQALVTSSSGITTAINIGFNTGQGSTNHSSGSLQPGTIAGIVIGSLAVFVIALLGTIFLLQRGSKNRAAAVSYRD
jgi:hypothetical protein